MTISDKFVLLNLMFNFPVFFWPDSSLGIAALSRPEGTGEKKRSARLHKKKEEKFWRAINIFRPNFDFGSQLRQLE